MYLYMTMDYVNIQDCFIYKLQENVEEKSNKSLA